MATIIDAVYENGVFRPLRPVGIPEGAHVSIALANGTPAGAEPGVAYPELPVTEYVLDELGDDEPIPRIPLEFYGTVQAKFVFAGELPPLPYPCDDGE